MGGLASIYVLVFVLGVQCVARYLTWLTSAVALALLFVFGTWFELVYRRWRIMGVVAFSAALTAVLAAGAVATTQAQAWAASATFSAPSACLGLTGLLVGLTVVLVTGGLATIRRITV